MKSGLTSLDYYAIESGDTDEHLFEPRRDHEGA